MNLQSRGVLQRKSRRTRYRTHSKRPRLRAEGSLAVPSDLRVHCYLIYCDCCKTRWRHRVLSIQYNESPLLTLYTKSIATHGADGVSSCTGLLSTI